jgi:thymidylate kinase
MLYILEGPRNSGKTTAVKRIQDAFGGRAYVIKFQRTAHPPVFMAEFLAKHYLALIDSRSICVLDRFHLTEFVMRTLDKKVDEQVLLNTTHMIDVMLKHCKAQVYVLQTSKEIRKERYKYRDPDHRTPEWPVTSELDDAWTKAVTTFSKCDTHIWSGDTQTDIDRLVVHIMKHQHGGKLLKDQIPSLPPIVNVEQLEEVVA